MVLARLTVTKMAPASAVPARWKENLKNGAHQCSHPWRKFYHIPAPPAHALKLASEFPSDMIHVLFKLGLGAGKFVHKPFKTRASVPHSPLALSDMSSTGSSKPDVVGSIFLVQVSQVGEPRVRLKPLVPRGSPPQLRQSFRLWVALGISALF